MYETWAAPITVGAGGEFIDGPNGGEFILMRPTGQTGKFCRGSNAHVLNAIPGDRVNCPICETLRVIAPNGTVWAHVKR